MDPGVVLCSEIRDRQAEVAKLADAPDLGSGVERRASSSLALGTISLERGTNAAANHPPCRELSISFKEAEQ